MEPPSPARLYASLLGAILFAAGLAGFFRDLSWLNFLYVGSGAIGLLAAAVAARPYALCVGLLYTGLAIWDFSSRGWPHLAVGLLGLAAFAATHGSEGARDSPKRPRGSGGRLKPRAKAAAKGP